MEYYKKRLGAKQLGVSQSMILEGEDLLKLVEAYYGGEQDIYHIHLWMVKVLLPMFLLVLLIVWF